MSPTTPDPTGTAAPSSTQDERRRPNIVFLLSDDHAAHAIGAYGSIVNRTPHIDAIAAAGARLDNLFATNSLCAPSRASILTGTYSHVNGVTTLDTFIDAAQPTFITALREAGYRTAFVGKWHMGQGSSGDVDHDPQGFDRWDALIDQGEYHDPRFLSPDGLRVEPGYATDLITDLAIDWVESLDASDSDSAEPWCVLVWHKAPHRPWEPDAAHDGLYAADGPLGGAPIPVPATFTDDLAGRSDTARRAAMRIADHLTAEDLKQPVPQGLSADEEALWKYQRYMEDYLACVASVDDNVGRLTSWLADRGELEDTIVIYSSDQGFFLGDHGWFDKRFMYEESIRMPFVLAYPRAIASGQALDRIVTNVDIAPTLLEAAGAAVPARMQGRSFWRDLTDPAAAQRDRDASARDGEGFYYRYWMHDDSSHQVGAHYGYRTHRYTLIFFYNDGLGLPGCSGRRFAQEWELYDLEADPEELVNVADDPAYAQVRDELEARMWLAQREVGDEPHPDQPVPRLVRESGSGHEE